MFFPTLRERGRHFDNCLLSDRQREIGGIIMPISLQDLLRKRKREDEQEQESEEQSGGSSDGSHEDEGDEGEESIEDRIKRLEAELEGSNESDDESDSDDDDDDEGPDSDDAIKPLPQHMLPAPASKRKLRHERNRAESGLAATVRELMEGETSSLKAKPTVKEFTAQYEAHSHKSLYCRVCEFQAETKGELEAHWASAPHKELARIELKASFCNLCKKQFTSPAQLREHLSGRQHHERLQSAKGGGRGKGGAGKGGKGGQKGAKGSKGGKSKGAQGAKGGAKGNGKGKGIDSSKVGRGE